MKHIICYMHFREEGAFPTYQNLHSFLLNLFKKALHLAKRLLGVLTRGKQFFLNSLYKNHLALQKHGVKNENPNNKTI
jgi:hypothetical protein